MKKNEGTETGLYTSRVLNEHSGGESKPLVLIAEDHPVNQKFFSLIMDKMGYPSILANDGIDAVEKVQAHKPAIVFMDIQMPGMNGYEAAETLRRQGFTIPIIAVTASDLQNEREYCLKAGIDDLLIKPFKRSELQEILLKWINVRRNTPPAKPGEVFNAGELLDTFFDNKETVLSLISRFIERTGAQLEEIPKLLENENWENARQEVHMIKGAALTMSAVELGESASRMELALANSGKEEAEAAYLSMREAFIRFRKEAEEFMHSRS